MRALVLVVMAMVVVVVVGGGGGTKILLPLYASWDDIRLLLSFPLYKADRFLVL